MLYISSVEEPNKQSFQEHVEKLQEKEKIFWRFSKLISCQVISTRPLVTKCSSLSGVALDCAGAGDSHMTYSATSSVRNGNKSCLSVTIWCKSVNLFTSLIPNVMGYAIVSIAKLHQFNVWVIKELKPALVPWMFYLFYQSQIRNL